MVYLARELGKYGITVNAYAPGVVKTALSQFISFNASLLTNVKSLSFDSRRDESPLRPRCAYCCECFLELHNRLNLRGVLSLLEARWLIA